MGKLSLIDSPDPKISVSLHKIDNLLSKSIVTQTISRLEKDPELNSWVRSGLFIHKNKGSHTCQFCGQTLPNGHLETLEKHFSDEYEDFLNQVKGAVQLIENSKLKIALHDRARFYKELQDPYVEKVKELEDQIISFNKIAVELLENLAEKEANIFKRVKASSNEEQTMQPSSCFFLYSRSRVITKFGPPGKTLPIES